MIKRIAVIILPLLLVSSGINATPTINKLVEQKVEISMNAPAPLPVIPVGMALKLMSRAIKKIGTQADELPYNDFVKIVKMSIKGISPKKSVPFKKAWGYVLLQEMTNLNLTIPHNFNVEKMGTNAEKIFYMLGDDIIHDLKNLEDLIYLCGFTENRIAADIFVNVFKRNKKYGLEKLASKVRIKMVAESSTKTINLPTIKPSKTTRHFSNEYGLVTETYTNGELSGRISHTERGGTKKQAFTLETGNLHKETEYDKGGRELKEITYESDGITIKEILTN